MIELRQRATLEEEFIAPLDEGFFIFLLLDAHAAIRLAAHQVARKILLDRNLHLKICIHCEIGDSKATDA